MVLEPQFLPLTETLERAALAEKAGADAAWLVQLPNQRDIVTVLAGIAGATETLRIGTGIVPAYTRPPVVAAQTALTLDELSGQRLALGLGLGHRLVGEWMVGAKPGPPVASMREYLTVVRALVRTGEVSFTGEHFGGHASYAAPRRADLPLLLGSFGPRMLELAGELADGVILWMCTPEYVRDQALPAVRAGLARAGRDPAGFEVVAIANAAVATDLAADRDAFRGFLASHLRVPTYRGLFERSGFGADVRAGEAGDAMVDALAAIGDPAHVADRVAAYRAAGATSVAVSPTVSAHLDRSRFLQTVEAAAGG